MNYHKATRSNRSRAKTSSRGRSHFSFIKKLAVCLICLAGMTGVLNLDHHAGILNLDHHKEKFPFLKDTPKHTASEDFTKAKQLVPRALANFHVAKQVAKQLFKDHRYTFYCDCKFDHYNRVDLHSCGYHIQQDKRRAERLEWEHIVPISHLAAHLECWKKPLCCSKQRKYNDIDEEEIAIHPHDRKHDNCFRGRKCCQQINADFAKMEADLHNLVPEIGELNALRSNYRFGELPGANHSQFGQCEIKIDSNLRRVEPRAEIKGIIARAYLYMADTYDFQLSDSQRQLFTAWNHQYPPDAWEIEWDHRIYRIQGNHNLYVVNHQNLKK